MDIAHLNDLCALLKTEYGSPFSLVHLIDVDAGGRRVSGPQDGDGYVYSDGTGGTPLMVCDNELTGEGYRAPLMTHPIFTTDRGTRIDLKNGIWKNGSYSARPLRLIMFSALNHHSYYCGATSTIKNYMGISDINGGPDPHDGGLLTGGYYNFHAFPFDKWSPGPSPGMLGKVIGYFLRMVRKADLNITTFQWVGLSSRTEPPVARSRAVLASTDPVALDYHAAKYVLYPNSRIRRHNPDHPQSPLREYLLRCAREGAGCFDEKYVQFRSYDFVSRSLATDEHLPIPGKKAWGKSLNDLAKYFILRFT